MRLEHPIFNTPLRPDLSLARVETPKEYLSQPSGEDVPEETWFWRVQEQDRGA